VAEHERRMGERNENEGAGTTEPHLTPRCVPAALRTDTCESAPPGRGAGFVAAGRDRGLTRVAVSRVASPRLLGEATEALNIGIEGLRERRDNVSPGEEGYRRDATRDCG